MAQRRPAPIRGRAAAAGLTFFAALALLADILLWLNATSLRGTVSAADYRVLSLEAIADGGAQGLEPDIPADGVYMDGGVLHIRGALYRRQQQVGAVNLHVGLIWTPKDGTEEDTVTLLNTQLVRLESADAQALGVDDHCGFHAAVNPTRLPHQKGEGSYRVVLADDTTGCLVDTDLAGLAINDGLTVVRKQVGADE